MKHRNNLIRAIPVLCCLAACGSTEDTTAALAASLQLNLSGMTDEAQSSYLPLTPGLTTIFPNRPARPDTPTLGLGLVIPDTENLAVQVLDNGVVQISGRQITGADSYVDIVETLYFTEDATDITLTKATLQRTDSAGSVWSNERTYVPPVTFIHKKDAVDATFDAYENDSRPISERPVPTMSTFPVTVAYSGDQETYEITTEGESHVVSVPDALANIQTQIPLQYRKSVNMNGTEVQAYRLKLHIDPLDAATVWYSVLPSVSRGEFWIAKGIGIVGLADYEASKTNAVE